MPIRARWTLPSLMSWSATLAAMSIGTAKPMPSLPRPPVTIAEFTPMTSPLMLTSGPPELPGLIGASVWRNDSYSLIPTLFRSVAEMMPVVTLWLSSNGEPTAMTSSPTFSLLLSPRGKGG